ncbi:MAG: acyl-CoA thioesterase [Rhodospirillaceae bacterium]
MSKDSNDHGVPLAAGSSAPAGGDRWNAAASPFSAAGERRADYGFHTAIPLRWSDFDMMGHVNNVQYMRFFESAVVEFFRSHDVFSRASSVTVFAAENMCRFLKPLNYPLYSVECGMRVERLGGSSVRFGFALFRKEEEAPSAVGYWVQVFIDRQTLRTAPMPQQARDVFTRYVNPSAWTMSGA